MTLIGEVVMGIREQGKQGSRTRGLALATAIVGLTTAITPAEAYWYGGYYAPPTYYAPPEYYAPYYRPSTGYQPPVTYVAPRNGYVRPVVAMPRIVPQRAIRKARVAVSARPPMPPSLLQGPGVAPVDILDPVSVARPPLVSGVPSVPLKNAYPPEREFTPFVGD